MRRAELAFNLLGRQEEFIQYYEQNRFGDTKIGGGAKDGADDKNETRSSLSSLTGDDVSVGTDRIFFAKSLPHLCASVVGFSAVEAALEVGNFGDDEDTDPKLVTADATKTTNRTNDSATRFRDSSARYERSLVTELGNLLRETRHWCQSGRAGPSVVFDGCLSIGPQDCSPELLHTAE